MANPADAVVGLLLVDAGLPAYYLADGGRRRIETSLLTPDQKTTTRNVTQGDADMTIIDFHNHYYPPAYLDALRSGAPA